MVGLRGVGLGVHSFPFEVRAVALHYYFFKIIKIDLNTDFVSNCHIKYLSIQVVHICGDLVHLLNLLVFYSWLHFLDVFFYLLQIVGFEVYHLLQLFVLLLWLLSCVYSRGRFFLDRI